MGALGVTGHTQKADHMSATIARNVRMINEALSMAYFFLLSNIIETEDNTHWIKCILGWKTGGKR